MKIRRWSVCSAVALAAALCVGQSSDKEKSKPSKPGAGEPGMEEMMKKMVAAATPGAAHKSLEPLAGEWNMECRFWMAGPEGPPTESKGTTKAKWILGGRFLQEEVSSEMMGQPFNGIGLTGYDNVKQKYVSTWVDNMMTGIMHSEGTVDAAGKLFTFQGKTDDAMTGQKDKPFKFILRIDSPDKHTFEMHDPTLGAKTKTGEIIYTRK